MIFICRIFIRYVIYSDFQVTCIYKTFCRKCGTRGIPFNTIFQIINPSTTDQIKTIILNNPSFPKIFRTSSIIKIISMHPFIHLINAMTLFTVLQGLENHFLIILKGLHRLQSGKTIKDSIKLQVIYHSVVYCNKCHINYKSRLQKNVN